MTIVVNLRDFRRSGSQSIDLPPDVARIDRRTPWGNPFVIGATARLDGGPAFVLDRETSLAVYHQWLAQRLAIQPDFLEPLRGKRLACWCAPLACHGDVIADLLGEP